MSEGPKSHGGLSGTGCGNFLSSAPGASCSCPSLLGIGFFESPVGGECSLPGGVQLVRFGTTPTVAPMVELMDVKGYALALAGDCVTVAESCRTRRIVRGVIHRGLPRLLPDQPYAGCSLEAPLVLAR
jgi:hypothetical protein